MAARRQFLSAEEKVAILKEHLLDKKPLSDICDKYHIHPTLFYRWQKQFFEKGTSAFRSEDDSKKNFFEKKIAQLENRLIKKNEVVSDLMEENLKLKIEDPILLKNLGEI